jgi:PAS domain S-box-containing protein
MSERQPSTHARPAADARGAEAGRRDATLDAVAFAAQRFLEEPTWEDAVPEALRRLGEATGASRAYVFETTFDEEGDPLATQRFEWVAEGVRPQIGNEHLRGARWSRLGLSRWASVLSGGEVIQGHVRDLPPQEHAILLEQDVKSILEVPILVGGRWWGLIGFDDCVAEREWTGVEVDALRAAAGVMGAAIGRRATEDRALAAERKYRALVERIPAITYRETPDGDPEGFYISPQVAELFGYDAETWRWTPDFWLDRVHPGDRRRVLEEDMASTELGAYRSEYRFRAANGEYRWVHDEATLVAGEGDEEGYWQGFILDVTERKRAEEQLAAALHSEREAAARLRTLDEMKNTFLQAVSHDLRTPLAAILGLAVTLEREEVALDAEETRDLARRIATNARKLARMVTDLLDLDRLARGIVEPRTQQTDVGELVRRVVAEPELLASRDVRVDAPEVVVTTDAAKVERIVENLLANTSRHTPAETRVWVRVERVDAGALVVVEDDGPGVPEELRDEIFEAFRQGPQRSEHSPGVGVGLALVARFAELLGGRAWVEERPGGGASFRVLLADAGASGPGDDGAG